MTARRWLTPHRVAWTLVCAVLVTAPLCLSLTRQQGFRSSVTIYPPASKGGVKRISARYLNRLRQRHKLVGDALNTIGRGSDRSLARGLSVRRIRGSRLFRLSGSADTPEAAETLVHVFGTFMAAVAGSDAGIQGDGFITGPPTAPPLRRVADRFVNSLPGPFPARAEPGAAALAGFAVAALLFAGWQLLAGFGRDVDRARESPGNGSPVL